MTATEHEIGPGVVLPPARRRPGAVLVDAPTVLAAVAAAAAADLPGDVVDAVLQPVCAMDGVRAGAVVVAETRRSDGVVLGSRGYPCGTMARGATLPRDAGLPVTEAVRTGRTVVVGPAEAGPSWVAVPVPLGSRRRAALLVSLTGPRPDDVSVALLERLGVLLGAALGRALRTELARTALLVLEEGLAPRGRDVHGAVVHSLPYEGTLSGDVVDLVVVGDVRWLLVADVRGRGCDAAVAAAGLRSAFRASAPLVDLPSTLLAALDRALDGGEEEFATALVVRVRDGVAVVASAGHPAPLLRVDGRVQAADVPPGTPLGLRLGRPRDARDVSLGLSAGAVLVACTDGLVDRRPEVDLLGLLEALPHDLPPTALADALLAGCLAAGPSEDDTSLVVLSG